MSSRGISKLRLAIVGALLFVATGVQAGESRYLAGTIQFTRQSSSGAEDTVGVYCDQSGSRCKGRRKHNGEVVLEKPVSRQKAQILLEQYSKPDKLPRRSPPLSADVRKLSWQLSYGSFSASGENPIPGTLPIDSRVRILEAELSALVGRAP